MSKPDPVMSASLKTSMEHSKTEYVQLGKSGLRISNPVFGCMSFGDPRWVPWVIGEDEVCLSLFLRLLQWSELLWLQKGFELIRSSN